MIHFRLLSFLPLLLLCSGCATIFSGSEREVRFESSIQGTQVQVDGGQWWPTPTTLTLGTDKTHSVAFQHPDGTPQSSGAVNQHFNPVALFNLIGPIPWLVDILTGAMWKLDQVVTDPAMPSVGSAYGGGGYGRQQQPAGRQSGW
ncbi:MAG: hypothetical protein NUW37_05225 [Planctomycetes bacterium]|nr:hypothetical protein [Planctomycetota bacterium]